MSATDCDNCGRPGGRPVSFDLDLPTITLCPICSVAIVSDRALFSDLGKRPTAAERPVETVAVDRGYL